MTWRIKLYLVDVVLPMETSLLCLEDDSLTCLSSPLARVACMKWRMKVYTVYVVLLSEVSLHELEDESMPYFL